MTSADEDNYVQNNVFFDPMQVMYKVLTDTVIDVNKVRSIKETARERQWIFATTPESNDDMYPRLALIPGTVTFETYGAGNNLEQVDNGLTGNDRRALRDHYGKIAIVPMTIGVFVRKKQKYEVSYYNGEIHKIQNSKASDWIGNEVAKQIQINRNEFIKAGIDVAINSISTSYEDNEFLWAKNIEVTITVMDVWTRHYSEADLIKIINVPEIIVV